MKKEPAKRRGDDLRPEYDPSCLEGGVRGKYYKQAKAGANLVLLDPDVARAFPDGASVNRALRLLQDVATKASGRTQKPARHQFCPVPTRSYRDGGGLGRARVLGGEGDEGGGSAR